MPSSFLFQHHNYPHHHILFSLYPQRISLGRNYVTSTTTSALCSTVCSNLDLCFGHLSRSVLRYVTRIRIHPPFYNTFLSTYLHSIVNTKQKSCLFQSLLSSFASSHIAYLTLAFIGSQTPSHVSLFVLIISRRLFRTKSIQIYFRVFLCSW